MAKKTKETTNWMAQVRAASQNPMGKTIGGMVLIFLSLTTFLAQVSFLFTWTSDQSALSKPFFDLMADADFQVNNMLGKLGAALSHQLIYRWTGLASFGFPGLCCLWGFA